MSERSLKPPSITNNPNSLFFLARWGGHLPAAAVHGPCWEEVGAQPAEDDAAVVLRDVLHEAGDLGAALPVGPPGAGLEAAAQGLLALPGERNFC